MDPKKLAVIETFFKHYLWFCDVFCVKPERHEEYRQMAELLNELKGEGDAKANDKY